MNGVQSRRYLALLANTPELASEDIIGISFDHCRVDFIPSQSALSWRARLSPAAGAVEPDTSGDMLGILLEANGMDASATFSMTKAGELFARGGTLLDGLTEESLAAQVAEFIDYVEFWQQQLAASAA